MRAIPLSRDARHRHDLDDAADARGGLGVGDVAAARRAAQRINLDRAPGRAPGPPTVTAGELIAVGVLHEVFHRLVERYEATIVPGAVSTAVNGTQAGAGGAGADRPVRGLTREFGRDPVPPGHDPLPPEAAETAADAAEAREEALVEGLLLSVLNEDPAAGRLRDLFDDRGLRKEGAYPRVLAALEAQLAAGWASLDEAPADVAAGAIPDQLRRPLPELLRAPSAAT